MNQLSNEDFTEKLHERVKFLINQLPKMEVMIDKVHETLNSKSGNLDVTELMKFYNNIFSFYNRSLELIRKIIVYYPLPDTNEYNELIMNFKRLSPSEKVKIIKQMKETSCQKEE